MLMQTHEARLDALRKELARQGLDGFVIPISDEHLSEYVGAYAQRLQWLTGFGGSAGTAAVLKDKAAIFVDGRYTLQVRDQVDGRLYEYKSVPQDSIAEWLAANAGEGAKVGFDPWLHTSGWAKGVAKVLEDAGALGCTRLRAGRGSGGPLEREQACRGGRVAQGEEAGRGGDLGARFGRLAAQHSRGRRGPHTRGAVLRRRPCGRHGRLVHRAW